MIHGVLIFNNAGKPRLTKFFSPSSPQTRAKVLQRIFTLVSSRGDTLCNFVELPPGFGFGEDGGKEEQEDEDLRVIYRHYATLYFVFVVDQSESELGILDLIQVFVESLDRCFENVCELDLIFHFDEVHVLLSCMITGGLVLDTSIDSIQQNFLAQMSARKSSASSGLGAAMSLGGIQQAVSGDQWDLTSRLGIRNLTGRRR